MIAATIGSSDVAGILGWANPRYDSPWAAWMRLAGLVERYSHDDANPDIERGRMLEPGILRRLGRELGVTFAPGPTLEEPPQIGPEPWMAARADGIAPGLIGEAKGPRTFARDDGWDTPHGPRHYNVQVRWQLACYDLPAGIIAAFSADPTDNWRTYRVERDLELEALIVGAVRTWRQRYLVDGAAPPLDGTEACTAALGKLYPGRPPRRWLTAAPDIMEAAKDLRALRIEQAEIDARARARENQIRAAIGDHYGLRTPTGEPLATLSQPESGSRRFRLLEE